jgi:predicted dienelactone hydrolase
MNLCLALAFFAQEDPARTGPHEVVVATRKWRDEARNRSLRTEIWRPEILDPLSPAPVVVYSHGFAGNRLQSRLLCSHLASHGYVVASVDHAASAFVDLNIFRLHLSARERPHDLRVVLDKLGEECRSQTSPFAGRLDLQRAAAVGHSLGGYTALAAAGAWLDLRSRKENGDIPASEPDYMDFDDARIVAAVAHAPVMGPFLTPQSVRNVVKPVLILAGSRDAQSSPRIHQQPLFDSLPGLRYFGVVDGATHYNFMDQDFLDAAPAIVRLSHFPRIERKLADAVILRQTTAFLERHLRGTTKYDAWLTKQDKLEWKAAYGSTALP